MNDNSRAVIESVLTRLGDASVAHAVAANAAQATITALVKANEAQAKEVEDLRQQVPTLKEGAQELGRQLSDARALISALETRIEAMRGVISESTVAAEFAGHGHGWRKAVDGEVDKICRAVSRLGGTYLSVDQAGRLRTACEHLTVIVFEASRSHADQRGVRTEGNAGKAPEAR